MRAGPKKPIGLGSGKNNPALKFFQQEVVMGSDPINGSVALTGGGGLAARGFLRAGLGLVRGLARHGFGFILAVKGGVRHPASGSKDGSRTSRAGSRLFPPLGLGLKSVTAVGAITWGGGKRDVIIAAKALFLCCSSVASSESQVRWP